MGDNVPQEGQQFFPNSTGATFYGGQFNQAQKIVYHTGTEQINDGFKRLSEYAVTEATHDSKERFDAPKCHPRTRVAILRSLTDWPKDPQNRSRIMWISGAAGSGKSAIAQSTALQLQNSPHRPFSFFFIRSGGERRNICDRLISTLSYQLACSYREARIFIIRAIEQDPNIFSKSLPTQLLELLVKPLCSMDIIESQVLIIDGLDECSDTRAQCDIIRTFAAVLAQYNPPICVMFSSRREAHIINCFNQQSLFRISSHIVLDDEKHHTDEDIEVFLNCEFDRIKSTHTLCLSLPADWPLQADIEKLVFRASGQFIYASTVVNFIDNLHENPRRTLQVILGLFPPRNHEKPFAQLDELYSYITSRVIFQITTKQILTAIFAMTNFKVANDNTSPHFIDQLLSFDPGETQLALSQLHSIIIVPEEPTEDIRFHHKSFIDYALDRARSGEYFFDISECHLLVLRKLYQLYRPISHELDYDREGYRKKNPQHYAYDYFLEHLAHLDASAASLFFSEIDPMRIPRSCGNQRRNFMIDILLCDIHSELLKCPPDMQFAFTKVRNACDKYLHEILDECYQGCGENRLIFLATALLFCHNSGGFYYGELPEDSGKASLIDEICKQCMELPDVQQLWEADRRSLNLGQLLRRSSLIDFFTDETRSGKFFLSPRLLAQIIYRLLDFFRLKNDTPPPTDMTEYYKLGIRNIFIQYLERADTTEKLTERLLEIDFHSKRMCLIIEADHVAIPLEKYFLRYFAKFGIFGNVQWRALRSRFPDLANSLLLKFVTAGGTGIPKLPEGVVIPLRFLIEKQKQES